jgi:hypothetical protein
MITSGVYQLIRYCASDLPAEAGRHESQTLATGTNAVHGYKHRPRVTNTVHGLQTPSTGYKHRPRVTNAVHGLQTPSTGYKHYPRVTNTIAWLPPSGGSPKRAGPVVIQLLQATRCNRRR